MIDFLLNLDEHLISFVATYGSWTYGLLFLIIFVETGLVIMPFLPGDSLLFAAGALAGIDAIDIWLLYPLLFAAAVVGDNVNYWIGRYVGPRVFTDDKRRWLRREHLERTHRFFERYGHVAIILARFVPIVRTFMPFVAGIGRMTYRRYLAFDIAGGILWVSLFVFAGYFFGNIPFVQENFHIVVAGIIIISLVPILVEYLRHRGERATPQQ